MIALLIVLTLAAADAGSSALAPSRDGGVVAARKPAILSAEQQLKLAQLSRDLGQSYSEFLQVAGGPASSRASRRRSGADQRRLLEAWSNAARALGAYDDYLSDHEKDLTGYLPNLENLHKSRVLMDGYLAQASHKNPYDVLRVHGQELLTALSKASSPAAPASP